MARPRWRSYCNAIASAKLAINFFHSSGGTTVPRSIAKETPPLLKLLREDRRYKLDAYQFVRMGLTYAQDVLELGETVAGQAADDSGRVPRHVTGRDLCLALKQLAHEQYGRMAKLVLASWGIRSTSDFGEIVYNLIKIGEMSKSESDRRSDFDDVYPFDEALVEEFAITKE
jgi:uncharacterized repeat protein (TIGR04138 family)